MPGSVSLADALSWPLCSDTRQPSARTHRQPSTRTHRQPSARTHRQPSTRTHRQPNTSALFGAQLAQRSPAAAVAKTRALHHVWQGHRPAGGHQPASQDSNKPSMRTSPHIFFRILHRPLCGTRTPCRAPTRARTRTCTHMHMHARACAVDALVRSGHPSSMHFCAPAIPPRCTSVPRPSLLTQQHDGGGTQVPVPALPDVWALRLLAHCGQLQAAQLRVQLLHPSNANTVHLTSTHALEALGQERGRALLQCAWLARISCA